MKIVEFLIDDNDDTGVKTISLVDAPAMQSDFIAFSEDKPKPRYIALQKEGEQYKQVVAGLSIIPDKLIYRIDSETGEEYNGYFSQATIEQIRNKYHKELMTSNVNLDHNENYYIDAYLIESYILSTQARVDEVTAQGIQGAVIGAWYTQFKIEDKEIFQKVLNGEYNGFSIEAYLNRELTASLKNNFKEKEKKMKKNLIERFKDFLTTLEAEETQIEAFETALVPEQGFTLTWGEVGAEVTKTYTNEAGEEVTEPVGQGEFTIEDGKVIVVDEGSMLIEVREGAPAEDVPVDEVPMEDVVVVPEVEVPADVVPVEVVAPADEVPEGETPVLVVSDFDKPLSELIDVTKDGNYTIEVSVKDGAIATSEIKTKSELMAEHTTEIDALKAEIEALKVKLSEPIAEPVLTDSTDTSGDFKELTVYERVARRKGIATV